MDNTHSVDITLVTEGAYPYILGGVSKWVHQIISGLPHYRFALVFIGSSPDDYGEIKYTLPENVVVFKTFYLFQKNALPKAHKRHLSTAQCERMRAVHQGVFNENEDQVDHTLHEMYQIFCGDQSLSLSDFLYSREAWDYISEMYSAYCDEQSFTTYFWNVRSMHQPLWGFNQMIPAFPKARLIHSITTGYAGLLSSLVARETNTPLILTEHGIYTKERRIEIISQAMAQHPLVAAQSVGLNYFQKMWLRYFEYLAHLCYQQASLIVSLFSQAREKEIEAGADAAKTAIMANGVDFEKLQSMRKGPRYSEKTVVCVIGRVVEINDINTFIRAIQYILKYTDKPLKGWVIGQTNEEPEYVEACQDLIQHLGLANDVAIKGRMQLDEILPNVDLLMVSSISEGQPYAVLDALGAGIPAVCTDVGACREMIHGGIDAADQALGSAGRVAPVANPQALGQAALALIDDPELWQQASQVAQKRVKRYYHLSRMLAVYDDFYREYMN